MACPSTRCSASLRPSALRLRTFVSERLGLDELEEVLRLRGSKLPRFVEVSMSCVFLEYVIE